MSGTHVRWAVKLSEWQPVTKQQIRQAFARIQPEEIERLMKFVFLDDLKASLIGRLMIRNFVTTATGKNNAAIRIQRDARGKPYYLGEGGGVQQLDFNVSHQSGFTVLAGWWSTVPHCPLKLGVDVMKMEYLGGKSVQEYFRLMNRQFTTSEWKYINLGRGDADKIARFMRVWCLKESYVKNVGVGITVDLKAIDFQIKSPLEKTENKTKTTTTVKLNGNSEEETNWHFEETKLDDEHCVAVAIQTPPAGKGSAYSPFEDGFRFIDIHRLIENIEPMRKEEEIAEELCERVVKKEAKRV